MSKALVLAAGKTIGLVLFYYSFSITLTFYNRKIVKKYKLPLFTTVIHLFVKFIFAAITRVFLKKYYKEPRTMLMWPIYLKGICPAGTPWPIIFQLVDLLPYFVLGVSLKQDIIACLTSVMDIGLSNWSLEFITISLYTMTKTSVIVFVLLFAILLGLEKLQLGQLFVVLFIGLGLFLFTYKSTEFHMEGFLLVLSASFISGLRWGLTQKLGQKQELGLSNPIDFMYHIQPWMMVGLIPTAFALEGHKIANSPDFFACPERGRMWMNVGFTLLGGVLAFWLEFSEFLLVSRTSSLTLSISGILKEMLMIFLAEVFVGDRMSWVNAIGLVACLIGISIHVGMKLHAHTGPSPNTPEEDNLITGVEEEEEEDST